MQWALAAEPGESWPLPKSKKAVRALQTSSMPTPNFEITVHQDFNWWIPEGADPAPEVRATVEQAEQRDHAVGTPGRSRRGVVGRRGRRRTFAGCGRKTKMP